MRQQFRHRVQALTLADFVINLSDLVRAVLRIDLDGLGRTHELRGQFGNAFGVSGRKQQGLAVFGALAHHLGDVVKKAHVQHAVGLIQDQCVHACQAERAALQMVQDAAGRAHHHIRAVLQTHRLTAQGHTTTQGDDFHVLASAGQAADFLCDLVGQLACGAKDHRLNRRAG